MIPAALKLTKEQKLALMDHLTERTHAIRVSCGNQGCVVVYYCDTKAQQVVN
jgi:hypothetical protein